MLNSQKKGSEAIFLEKWRDNTALHPEKLAFCFSENGSEIKLNYQQLFELASRWSQKICLIKNQIILLCINKREEFVPIFLGCILAGKTPAIANPQISLRNANYIGALRKLFPSPVTLIGEDGFFFEPRNSNNFSISDVFVEVETKVSHGNSQNIPAFIQFSSGTTSFPKAIPISQSNLAANMTVIERAFRGGTKERVVNWLPFHHDMGLVGNLLQILWAGGSCLHLEPSDFVKRPAKWLQAISKFEALVSGGPDFCYRQSVNRIKDSEVGNLDLSCWRIAYNGAEPVRHQTIDSFASRFSSIGFKRTSFYPCYGFAETTLMATGAHIEREPVIFPSKSLISSNYSRIHLQDKYTSCGAPFPDHGVFVIDEKGNALPEENIGEVVTWGPSVFIGYLEPASRDRFITINDMRCFKTGDLGFLFEENVYIIGRVDDLLITKGRKLNANEIESAIVYSSNGLIDTCVVFVSEEGGYLLNLIVEIQQRNLGIEEANGIRASIKKMVSSNFDVTIGNVVFVKRGSIPKTTSGKITRKNAQQLYVTNQLQTLGEQ